VPYHPTISRSELIRMLRYTVSCVNGVKVRKCFWCDVPARLTRDHVVPLGAGGSHRFTNVVPACEACQRERNEIMHLYTAAKKLRRDSGKEYDLAKSIEKARRRQEKLQELIQKWVAIETERWGWSPSGSLDLSLPEVLVV
jgi:5-methylcytosine-specific restriction endonuclease McrA